MWRDLNAHLMRTLDPAALQALDATYLGGGRDWWPAIRQAVEPAVDDWIGTRIRANATRRGLRLRVIAEIASAQPDRFDREPFDSRVVPMGLMFAVRGVIELRARWWLARSERFVLTPT